MPKCFVIQPFGLADTKRYEDDLAPAILAGAYEPVRADRVSGVSANLIESTHSHIKESAACLADITEDNPNVWYEVGYALACEKPVILIRQKSSRSNPFDVLVHKTLEYDTHSSGDFQKLSKAITEELQALSSLPRQAARLPFAEIGRPAIKAGLNEIEIQLLRLMIEGDADNASPVTYATIQRILVSENGNTMLNANLAIKSLKQRGLLASFKWGGADALLITPNWKGWAKKHPEVLERISKENVRELE